MSCLSGFDCFITSFVVGIGCVGIGWAIAEYTFLRNKKPSGPCAYCGKVDSRDKVDGVFFCKSCKKELSESGGLKDYAKQFYAMEHGTVTEQDKEWAKVGVPSAKEEELK